MAGDCLYFAGAYYFIWSVMWRITAPEPGTATPVEVEGCGLQWCAEGAGCCTEAGEQALHLAHTLLRK